MLRLTLTDKTPSNINIQGNFFMHQTRWLNCTIGCWLLRWFEPLKFQLDLTPILCLAPAQCLSLHDPSWLRAASQCAVGPGVWSGWDPTVHYCPRVSQGVRAGHNCSHCISAALCVIINCPHNNWRFVILARISHSSSVVRLTSEIRSNNHSSVEWKKKYGLKSQFYENIRITWSITLESQ